MRFPHPIAQILPGDYFVSREPMIVYTVLGSCVSACILDPVLKIGGMNHFMLPEPKPNQRDSWGESTRYGSFAMELLINEILKRGGVKSRLEVKIFGGGKIFDNMGHVGLKNADWAVNYLQTENLRLVGSDVGDIYPRKIYYFTETGRVLVKKIDHVKNRTLLEREQLYRKAMEDEEKNASEVIFF